MWLMRPCSGTATWDAVADIAEPVGPGEPEAKRVASRVYGRRPQARGARRTAKSLRSNDSDNFQKFSCNQIS